MGDQANGIDVRAIMGMLPHRYPFLLVDKVLDYEPLSHIRALKNVTINEPFFQGHFPGLPIMPGVLILEAMAQAGAILLFMSQPDLRDGKLFMFAGIDKVRFRNPVRPGDQLILRCFDIRSKFTLWKMNAVAEVDGEVMVEAGLSAAILDKDAV